MKAVGLLLVASLAPACAGMRVVVVAKDARPIDAIFVEPLKMKFSLDDVAAYQKTNDVIEAVRSAGGLVIDGTEHDLPASDGAARLTGSVERSVIDEWVASGGADVGPQIQSKMHFHVVTYHLAFVLTGPDGRVISRATGTVDEDLSSGTTNPANPQPGLSAALKALAVKLVNALPLAKRAVPAGLVYLDTHARLLRHALQDVRGDEALARRHTIYSYFFPDLPIGWFHILAESDSDGVLLVRVPDSWREHGAYPGDLLVAIDGHHVSSAAACDRLLTANGLHELTLARKGEHVMVTLDDGPSHVASR